MQYMIVHILSTNLIVLSIIVVIVVCVAVVVDDVGFESIKETFRQCRTLDTKRINHLFNSQLPEISSHFQTLRIE